MQIKDALIQVLAEQGGDLVRHLSRVALLAGKTGARLGLSPIDRPLRLAAELHDIGKAAVPRAILEKPGPLDTTELAYLRQHSVIGERILAAAPALMNIAPLVRATHERADGGGYPDGFRLEQIPIGARRDRRRRRLRRDDQRAAVPRQRSDTGTRRAASCRGTQFDPVVVDAFLAVLDERDRMGADAAEHDEHVVSCPFGRLRRALARGLRAPGAPRPLTPRNVRSKQSE